MNIFKLSNANPQPVVPQPVVYTPTHPTSTPTVAQPSFSHERVVPQSQPVQPFKAPSLLANVSGDDSRWTRGSNSLSWMNRYREMRFTRVVFQEVNELPDIQRRSLTFSPHADGVQSLETAIEQDRGVTRAGIASAVGSMMYLGNPGEVCNIDHGWGVRRVRFILCVMLYPRATDGVAEYMIVCGYSAPFDGVSWQTRSIDPNMPLYVSHIHRINMSRQSMTPLALLATNVTLSAGQGNGILSNTGSMSMLRPNDAAAHADVMTNFDSLLMRPGVETVIAVNRLGAIPNLAQFGDTSPTDWMGRYMKAHGDHRNMQRLDAFSESSGVVDNPIERLLQNNALGDAPSRDPFLHAISSVGDRTLRACFCFNDLVAIDPGVSTVVSTELIGNERYGRIGMPTDADDINEVQEEARIAQTIAKSIGGVMIAATLSTLTFVYMSGSVPIVENAQSILGETFDFAPLIPGMLVRIEKEVLACALMVPGQMYSHYSEIRVMVDLMGMTTVSIKLDGNEHARYYGYPTAMEAPASSLVTENHQFAENFYSGVNAVVNGIIG